jgi:demethylmenaquinone methyltransferase / 2-methoxy-6-polyprenyl-1,4-benzoquinol methylase
MGKFAHDEIVPFKESELAKKDQVANMFDNIAFRYDFLNRLLSAGIDVSWRKKAIREIKSIQPSIILDVATGTADVAMLTYDMLHPKKIIGIDISDGMLNFGRKKLIQKKLDQFIQLQNSDSENIPFTNDYFDAITVAFGVRNFQHLEKGLGEIYRVLKPGGKMVVLEFSKPTAIGFKQFYQLYMNYITPSIGKIFSSNKNAYQYLNDSVQAFPEGESFLTIMNGVGFTQTYLKKLSFGICTIYCGSK